MRAAVRRIPSFMATPSNPNQIPFSNLSHRLQVLAQQLRFYKPPPATSDANADPEDAVVDDHGKVFSNMAVPESSAAPALGGPEPAAAGSKRAAVLVCLFEGEGDAGTGEFRVILTKRSSSLSTHAGEVSLPGGKADEGDADDRETALREAKEEIGLDPSLVTVLTVLEPFISKHLLRVVPVIGILHNKQAFRPVANAMEVDEIFDAPLEMFLKNENWRFEEREWMGVRYFVHYFDFATENKKFVIWGLTASILIRVASVVYQRPPFFEQFPKS